MWVACMRNAMHGRVNRLGDLHEVMERTVLGVPGRKEQVVRKAWSRAWQEKSRSRPGWGELGLARIWA